MSRLVYILNGPNLNLLGKRQPKIYGYETLADVERDCRKLAEELKLDLRVHQSNREYEIWIGFTKRERPRRHRYRSGRLHPLLGRNSRCPQCVRAARHRGAYLERAPARGIPASLDSSR